MQTSRHLHRTIHLVNTLARCTSSLMNFSAFLRSVGLYHVVVILPLHLGMVISLPPYSTQFIH
ncbi:hypothetical protein [Escherichia phage L27]|uniref:Uncharacterized protein n=3 Tax=Felixounavirus TaxID=1198140 RepID=A0A455XDC2_9CAUD|nr:hypothetical protein [Escherichia phage L27]